MKIALITDQHLGARENSTIILEHQRVFYDNVFFPYLIEHDIKVVVGLGDFWEKRKNTNNYIADQAKRMFFDRLKEHNIYHYMLVGNHDAPFKHTLFPNTPDTLLAEYDNIHVISYPQTISIDGFNVAMIPWICQENYDHCYEVIKNSPAITCMGHFEISGFKKYMNDYSIENTAISHANKILNKYNISDLKFESIEDIDAFIDEIDF